jgi:hypothetical protein
MSAQPHGGGRGTAIPRAQRVAHLASAAPAQPRAETAAVATTPPPLDPPLPPAVLQWLTQLTLLYGVPFPYLVADPKLLPPESLRFFYVDQNWTDRAVDGALSVATISTADHIFNEALFQAVYAAITQSQQALRATLRGKDASSQTIVGGTYTGLLLRSVVVSGWPGLEVSAKNAGGNVSILRMDRLSPTVLLVLFSDVPTEVDLFEPSETLHFGMLKKRDGSFETTLRGLSFGGYPAGQQIKPGGVAQTAAVATRTSATYPGVVDVAATVANITAQLQPLGALGTGPLTSGGFAIQMVQSAGKQIYTTSLQSRDCTVPPKQNG